MRVRGLNTLVYTTKIMFLPKTKRKVQVFLKFTHLPKFRLPDSQSTSQPAIRPNFTGCRASKITLNNSLLSPIYETAILKTIIPLHHGDSFALTSLQCFLLYPLICVNNLRHDNIPFKVIATEIIRVCHFCMRH